MPNSRKKNISIILSLVIMFLSGCNSPQQYRTENDKIAADIIAEKQLAAIGRNEKFSINRPSNIFRRRLLLDQNLEISSAASFGTDNLELIEHWPEKEYPKTAGNENNEVINGTPIISLLNALQIGAKNSFDYQNKKEEIFEAALDLELERHEFRNTFIAQMQSLLSTDTTGRRTVSGAVNSGNIGISRKFQSGAEIQSALAVDLANLFTLGNASSMGIAGEGSIAIPLLRGSGRHIVAENLTQAERNVIYKMWEFERFRKQYAVEVANKYLGVLQQLDSIKNSESDYKSRIASSRRSRKLADAGRLEEIEVDQAVQNELSARQRWIAAKQSYQKKLDNLKIELGLPTDAKIELASDELSRLTEPTKNIITDVQTQDTSQEQIPSADALIELIEPDYENAGDMELPEVKAVRLAFENRCDLKEANGKIYDAQRAVVIAADNLRAELTFLGSVNLGTRRNSVASAANRDAQLRAYKGIYSALLTIDLPFDRKAEAVAYRKSYIALEKSVRTTQQLEDSIKLQIRNTLRDLLEARENMYIQAKAVSVAQKRVKSVTMFLDAGRTEIRNLLEAQDALLSAQNELTSAVVSYRIAELNMQMNMGVLQIDENGLWTEYQPEGTEL